MKATLRFLLIFSVFVLVAGTALGQTVGQLGGTVTHEGTALPGVTITLTSPALQGQRVSVSNVNGDFNFPALPPGQYTVVFEMEGMATVTQVVSVSVNTTNRVTAAMELSAVAEQITVTATSQAVVEATEVVANLQGDLIEELPVGRTVLATALLAPGVNDNTISGSQLNISGAEGYDSTVMINGVSTQEIIRGQSLPLFIEDAIQETTVMTGGVSAEYGRFTGGVVNSITKSGGNEFSGSFRTDLTNPSWTDERPGETITLDKTNDVYQGTFGGRIVRDRLWFFLAGRKAEEGFDLQTSRTNQPYTQSRDEERYEIKGTAAITSKHNVVASYFEYDRTIDQLGFGNFYDFASMSGPRTDPQSLTSAHYNGIFTSNFLVEAHYQDRTYKIAVGQGGTDRDRANGSYAYDLTTGRFFNAPVFCGICDTERRDSDGYTLKGNYYLSTASLGSHNIVLGAEDFSEHRYANNYQSSADFGIYFFGGVINEPGTSRPVLSPNGFVYPIVEGFDVLMIWTPIFDVSNSESDLNTQSVFLNDKWDLNSHWSFNVGLRYDKAKAQDANGFVSSDDANVSPRITAIYDIGGDGRHRISAGYNRYVSKVGDGPATRAESAGVPASIYFLYGGPAINAPGTPQSEWLDSRQALAQMFAWLDSQGGTSGATDWILTAIVPGYDYVIENSLTAPYADEYTVGYGTQLGSRFYGRVDYIHREWKQFYDYYLDQNSDKVDDPYGLSHDVIQVVNSNNIKREYDAVQMQVGWRPLDRVNVGVNYTWSELWGNDAQTTSGSGTVGNDTMTYCELVCYDRRNPEGWMTFDQRHRLRAWVGWDVPLPQWFGALNLSVLQNWDSGSPYSAVGSVDPYDYAADELDSYNYIYSGLSSSGYNYYFSERGEYRLDDITSTDFAINWAHPLWKSLEIFAQAELTNAFGEEGVVAVNTTVLTSVNSSRYQTFDPRTETPVEGTHWAKSSTFGQATGPASYQPARTYQFSVGLRF